MANLFFLKQGDTFPNIEAILSNSEDEAVDLTGCTVLFRMSEIGDGNLLIEKSATVVTPQTGSDMGKVSAEFENGDTDIIGDYRVEWKVTFPNGKIATFLRGEGSVFNRVIIEEILD